MRKQLIWITFCSATIVATALYQVAKLHATPAIGFSGSTMATARFGEIDVFNHAILPELDQDARHRHKRKNIWLSWQKTKGDSDLYVQSNVWEPGGSTGWHSHPGHSLIIVTAGTVTAYEGDDQKCKPHVYTQGTGFVDPGGDHVHILRNEGTVEARTIALQLIPAHPDGSSSVADRRIDVPDPGFCSF
jgi:quercetin dioxygenase-like cupin family protein